MSRFVKTNNGYGGSEIRTDGLFEGVSVRFLYPLGKLRVRHNGTKELHVVSPKSETGVKYRVMIRIEEGGGKIGKNQQ